MVLHVNTVVEKPDCTLPDKFFLKSMDLERFYLRCLCLDGVLIYMSYFILFLNSSLENNDLISIEQFF